MSKKKSSIDFDIDNIFSGIIKKPTQIKQENNEIDKVHKPTLEDMEFIMQKLDEVAPDLQPLPISNIEPAKVEFMSDKKQDLSLDTDEKLIRQRKMEEVERKEAIAEARYERMKDILKENKEKYNKMDTDSLLEVKEHLIKTKVVMDKNESTNYSSMVNLNASYDPVSMIDYIQTNKLIDLIDSELKERKLETEEVKEKVDIKAEEAPKNHIEEGKIQVMIAEKAKKEMDAINMIDRLKAEYKKKSSSKRLFDKLLRKTPNWEKIKLHAMQGKDYDELKGEARI